MNYFKYALGVLTLVASTSAWAVPPCYEHGQIVPLDPDRLTGFIDNDVRRREIYIQGEVEKILPFDMKGLRHEKFIVNSNGRHVIIVHNIDIAPTVPVQVGQGILVCGEFLMSGNMPMVHWTHYDPSHRHEDGFIFYNNQLYGARPGRGPNYDNGGNGNNNDNSRRNRRWRRRD